MKNEKEKSNSALAKFLKLPKKYIHRTAEQKDHILSLRVITISLLVAVVMLAVTIVNMQSNMIFHIPPDTRGGAEIRPNEIPEPNVFIYSKYLWQEINSWSDDGRKDSIDKVVNYSNYLCKSFAEKLQEHYRENLSGISGRTRTMRVVEGANYSDSRVIEREKNQAWLVYLDMNLEEHMAGQLVKSTPIRYPLLVEKSTVDIEKNPLGVKLCGFYEKPTILAKTD